MVRIKIRDMYLVVIDFKTNTTIIQKVSNIVAEQEENSNINELISNFDAEAYVSANYDISNVQWGLSHKVELDI